MKINNWVLSKLGRLFPNIDWHSQMSVKLVNYLIRESSSGHCIYWVALDDNDNLAIYELD